MADFSTLKEQVAAVIKANGTQSITGTNFQAQLFNIIDSLNSAKADAVTGKGLSTNDLTNELLALVKGSVQEVRLLAAIADAVKNYVAKADVVQATGTDTEKVMSQKATTAALAGKVSTTDGVTKSDIVSEEGSSTTKVMSQQIVTNALTQARTQIASNSTAIASNKSDIARVNETLGQHTQQIADNAEDIDTNATAIDAINALVARLNRDFGRYDNPTSVTLTQSISGKYVHKDTAKEVSARGYGISTPIALKKGDLLLVPSASAVVAECSVVSRQVTNPYDRVILYAYTYDAGGRIATATADYDTSLVYTAHYADEETMAVDYWTIGSKQVSTLPSTYAVTESFYVPLVQQSVAAMPSEGYYIYLASEAMDVVISGFTATVNGGVAILAGWGVLKNIASNFVGIDGQQVLAEALNNLAQRVAGIEAKIAGGFSELTVGKLHIGRGIDGLNIDTNFYLEGAGAPSADVVPEGWKANWFAKYGDWRGIPLFKGQWYYDTVNKNLYRAKGTESVSDWQLIK